jgi:hypothetical protein
MLAPKNVRTGSNVELNGIRDRYRSGLRNPTPSPEKWATKSCEQLGPTVRKAEKAELDQLRAHGFHVSDRVYRKCFGLMGE